MKSVKRSRRLLALALCICCAILPGMGLQESVSAASTQTNNLITQVRVGLCLPEKSTGVTVSSALSGDGFMVGTYRESDRSFVPAFGLSSTSLAILPDRNANLTFREDGTVSGKSSSDGNYGAYNLTDGKIYTGYTAALTEACKKIDGFVAWVDGGYQVRFGRYNSYESASAAAGTYRVASPVEGGIALVDGKSGKTVLEYECTVPLALRSKNSGEVSLNTVSARHGYLGFFVFYASSKMKVINVIDMETYTKCVMSNEIGTSATVETRRAFSLLVRTVALHASKHDKQGADVCYTTCCQVYLGTYRRSAENDAIVDSTKGEYVAYQGEPISCLYHKSNGGASCSSVAAWGNSEIPYLTSVTLKENADNVSEMWQYTFTQKELYDFLSSRDAFDGLEGGILGVSIDGTDPYGSGYVTLLSVTDRYGNAVSVKTSEKVRTALKFQSANFTVSYYANAQMIAQDGTVAEETAQGYVDANGEYVAFDSFEEYAVTGGGSIGADTIRFDGVGIGHGVGFSSNGSEQLAEQGYSYRYILQFYFQGTEILNLYD